jgi:hypothetical protein
MLPFLKPSSSAAVVAPNIDSIGKLLLNSWSAEYALRIPPLDDKPESLTWCFPQAYYGPLFGARAVLLVHGMAISNEMQVRTAMQRFYLAGYYQPNFPAVRNPFAEVLPLRISSQLAATQRPTNVLAYHQQLVEHVEQIARCHERVIMRSLGVTAYRELIGKMPEYLRESFLADRTSVLLCEISRKGGANA